MYWFYDYWYFVLVVPALLFSLIASVVVQLTYRRYAQVAIRAGFSGAEAARRVLEENGVSGVKIERTGGELTDYFDPKNNSIYLSYEVFAGNSCAAVGVAAHEAGHAVQHAIGYLPLRIRAAIIPATNFGSRLALPLIILGLVFSSISYYAIFFAYVGVAAFGLSTLFQLVTLPTEFDASRRAMSALVASRTLDRRELSGARKVLTAAAMTYVAALAVSLTQLLRLWLIVSGGRRRR